MNYIVSENMVSIITVNYNGWKDTCELIASLKKHETLPYEVIVVDNASQWDYADKILHAHPDVMVIRSKVNLGFAGGNNLGYRHAKGDYLFFVNNDVVVKSSVLSPLVQRLQNEQVGGVSPCILSLYKPDEVQYYGYCRMSRITLKHTTLPFDYSRRRDYMYAKETEVLHGAAMMFRRDVIEHVGCMSEIYFLFYEEFDWSYQMQAAGYKLFYEPASVVYHKEAMTLPKQTPLREYYLSRSRMIFARKNLKGMEKCLSCIYLSLLVMPVKFVGYVLHLRTRMAWKMLTGTISGIFVPIR